MIWGVSIVRENERKRSGVRIEFDRRFLANYGPQLPIVWNRTKGVDSAP